MDTKALVEAEIGLGRQALEALSVDDRLNVRSAMWMLDDNRQEWLFTISTSFYERHGAQAAYLRVRKTLEIAGLLDKIQLDRVAIISDNHPVISAIRIAFGSLKEGFLVNCMVNGTRLPDVYIYRIEKRRAGVRKKGAGAH